MDASVMSPNDIFQPAGPAENPSNCFCSSSLMIDPLFDFLSLPLPGIFAIFSSFSSASFLLFFSSFLLFSCLIFPLKRPCPGVATFA